MGEISRFGTVRKFRRIGLFLAILLQLTVVLLGPYWNDDGGPGVPVILVPYFNFFEFVANWSFFAPDPGTAQLFLEWELVSEGGQTLEFGQMPSIPSPFFFNERQTRRNTAVRHMLAYDLRVEKMMVPYLCKGTGQDKAGPSSKVFSVRLWRVSRPIPSLTEMSQKKSKIGDPTTQERHWISHSFCQEYS